MRLQDMPGYPVNMNYAEVLDGDFSPNELSEWATDLLAYEGKCWLRADNEIDQVFALSLIGSIRPLMETLTQNQLTEANPKIMVLVVQTYLTLSKSLSKLKEIAIEEGLRSVEES